MKYITIILAGLLVSSFIFPTVNDKDHSKRSKKIKKYQYFDRETGRGYKMIQRIYLNDSVFCETILPVINTDTIRYKDNNFIVARNKYDTFKVINNTWYYLFNNNYYFYFNTDSFYKYRPFVVMGSTDLKPDILGIQNCVSMIPKDTFSQSGKTIFRLSVRYGTCTAVLPDKTRDFVDYCFDPTIGIVTIETRKWKRDIKVLEYY
jgi:hypothetical protein